MTVHARRYGRWCREHCDAQGRPIPRPPLDAEPEASPAPDLPSDEQKPDTEPV